ncbi:MAG: hypothetical protein PHS31_08310 [Victivallaceae bacterium]|nr:hypothetical protein [Victivallaceae bacterium]
MKKIRFMETSFRDGFQSCLGARVKTDDIMPAFEAALAAGTEYFEIGGGARFQSLYFYCQEDAYEMMDKFRAKAPNADLQTLSRGLNVVGLVSQSRDIINLHATTFAKHGVSTIRNFDALNDVRNLAYSGACITNAGASHQVTVALMGLPPGCDDGYPHSAQFYIDTLKNILKAEIPFKSVAFKDASGTTVPSVVYETIKEARKLLGKDVPIHFHTHETAGLAVSSNFAAIEAGADCIDLAMAPLSGGTCEVDILTMWRRLKGTGYVIDIDPKKILEAERVFTECLDKYEIPPESNTVSPMIIFSPMPGGALTANTQMMRDTNTLPLFGKVIAEMEEVVRRGGFGTSVTPVSQFYFQQAFLNATVGPWKKINEGYGKMVLGYFGHTPAEPDAEIVKIASEQLGLEPTKEDIHDLNDKNPKLGIAPAKKQLEDAGLPTTDENIFIVAACGDKGLAFLQGDKPLGIRYKTDAKTSTAKSEGGNYSVNVDGQSFNTQVSADGASVTVNGKVFKVSASEGGAAPVAAAAASSCKSVAIVAPMPGSVFKIVSAEGDQVNAGDTVLIIEAMKMEIEVKSEHAGTISKILVAKGENVNSGQTVVELS